MNQPRIWASIASIDLGELVDKAAQLEEIGVDGIHVDVADGVFVPDLTFGARAIRTLTARCSVPVEAHLMVTTPEEQSRAAADAGAKRVAFHIESTRYPRRVAGLIASLGPAAGAAINPATCGTLLGYLADCIDFVNVLSTEPDLCGERYLPLSVVQVAAVRAALPGVEIEVDGGIGSDVVASLQEAGATDFVVGRALVEAEDPALVLRHIRATASGAHRPAAALTHNGQWERFWHRPGAWRRDRE